MKLPVIKKAFEHIKENGEDSVKNTISVLEDVSQARGLKDNEIEVIGEIISNLCGALEVKTMVDEGKEEREALNTFMQRVLGSIDK